MKKKYRILQFDELRNRVGVYIDEYKHLRSCNGTRCFTISMENIAPFKHDFDYKPMASVEGGYLVERWMVEEVKMEVNWGKEFKKFLKSRGIYWEFKYNLLLDEEDPFEKYTKTTLVNRYIESAFDWYTSVKGNDYWINYNDLWQVEIKNILNKTN